MRRRRAASRISLVFALLALPLCLKPSRQAGWLAWWLLLAMAVRALFPLIGIILGGAPWRAVVLAAVMAPGLWALFDRVLGLPLDFLGELFV